MSGEDRALLARIAAGDEAAFTAFYRMYETRLFRFIKSKLNDSFEAADILNETFLDVWRKAGTFEGRSRVTTWLFGMAYYKTMDRFRKKNPGAANADDPPDIADDAPDAMACLLDAEDAAHIRSCLDRLKEAHRTVMELAFFEDMAYAEIAAVAGCPENTVKTRMFHAKQLMKRCLETHMGGRA